MEEESEARDAQGAEASKSWELIRSQIAQVEPRSKAKIALSATANRITMGLISQIDYEQPDWDKTYAIRVMELAAKSGIQLNWHEVSEITAGMASTVVGVVVHGGKRLVWRPFFKEIAYEDGVIHAIFNERMSDLLSHLRDFIKISLDVYFRLKTAYAQNLWELLSYFRAKSNTTPDYDIPSLQDKLGVPKALRTKFYETKVILNRAKAEIEEKTDMRFVWETDRKYRPTKVTFYLGRTRLPHVEEREKLKEKNEAQKNAKALLAWKECKNKTQETCEHYPKSRRAKCALCRKMEYFSKNVSAAPLFK